MDECKPLANGLRGHFYDRGNEFIDEVTAPAPAPPDRPLTLRGLLQAGAYTRSLLSST